VSPETVGNIGMLFNFAVTIALTPLFPALGQKMPALIDFVRQPEDVSPRVNSEDTPEH